MKKIDMNPMGPFTKMKNSLILDGTDFEELTEEENKTLKDGLLVKINLTEETYEMGLAEGEKLETIHKAINDALVNELKAEDEDSETAAFIRTAIMLNDICFEEKRLERENEDAKEKIKFLPNKGMGIPFANLSSSDTELVHKETPVVAEELARSKTGRKVLKALKKAATDYKRSINKKSSDNDYKAFTEDGKKALNAFENSKPVGVAFYTTGENKFYCDIFYKDGTIMGTPTYHPHNTPVAAIAYAIAALAY